MRRKIYPYHPHLKELARQLRNNSTKAEIRLWQELKGDQMLGFDFHRQKPIDKYILDFFCHELVLGIEVDGITHENAEVKKKDKKKEEKITSFEITLLRFTDEQVLEDMDYVLETIRAWIYLHTHSHTPGPSQEGKNAGGH